MKFTTPQLCGHFEGSLAEQQKNIIIGKNGWNLRVSLRWLQFQFNIWLFTTL